MTPITITGALTMLSTNGDGAQLLTEAAEFLNALAQMGVQMAVEINLRPVGVPAELSPAANFPPVLPQRPVDLALRMPEPPAARGSANDITLYEGHPSLTQTNPTPAAPAQPEEPQWDLTPHVVRLRGEAPEWRKLSREQRTALLNMEGRKLAKQLGHAPTMVDWDASRPSEYPSASGVSKYLNIGWTYLAANWSQS